MPSSIAWDRNYPSRRSPVWARNVVIASQPLAAQAGIAILKAGGSAVDAAIATAATLMVVEPVSSGLGGDAFALVWNNGELVGMNASGRSPRALPPGYHGGKLDDLGWQSVTVPGAVSGWTALWKRFGKLPFAKLFEPAIDYAREGFPVTPIVARVWRGLRPMYLKFPELTRCYYPSGESPSVGSLCRFPELAESLQAVAQSDGMDLYHGELARRIVTFARDTGGHLCSDDLAEHRADWVDPIRVTYRGVTVNEMPPNSQGIATLIALGILGHFDLARHAVDSAESMHLQIEAMKIALADAYTHVADPAAMRSDAEELLDPGRLQRLAAKISPRAEQPESPRAPATGGTTYLTVGDARGMLVSYIQSSGPGFGSGLMVPDTGIALQSRANAFHADPAHPNTYAPHKRPFHTNSPALVALGGGEPLMSFGLMGWSMQPQAHVQFVVRAVDYGQSPQAILDAPRWRIAADEPAIVVEPEVGAACAAALAERGHNIVKTEKFFAASTPFGSHLMFGGAQMIYCTPDCFLGASDPRRDGGAVGF